VTELSRTSTPAGLRGRGPFLQEEYANGDLCDLTGDARRAAVRYVCQEESSTVSIISITEVVTCSYIVVVSSPQLCKHPFFSRQVRPVLHSLHKGTQKDLQFSEINLKGTLIDVQASAWMVAALLSARARSS
jgi:hypothetical protein